MRFLAMWGGNLSFWGTKKGLSDTSTSPMDRARRVLSGAIILRSGASRLTNWWAEYWVLGVFGAVIWAFRAQGRIDLKHQSLQSIELVELYLATNYSDFVSHLKNAFGRTQQPSTFNNMEANSS